MHTVDEFKFVLNLAPAVNSGWPSIWIGLVRNTTTGLFEWTDGTTSTYYKNWATNYPEAASSGNNCVAMYPYDAGRWATANCGWQADAYVCKKV
ncbi:hypothetical protein AAVH_12141 [Aphelenchoides avenae]|nr:hypothetical protein AAVH_12141 [Aphelenchus avenae]